MLVSLCDLSGCTEAKCFYLGSSYPHNSYTIIQVRRGAAPWLFRTSWKEIIMKQADTGRPVSDWNSLPRDPHHWRFYMQIDRVLDNFI